MNDSEKTLLKVTRALRIHSEFNKSLIRAADENGFINDVCRIIVESGGYRMAWVGFAGTGDEKHVVRPVAQKDFRRDYPENAGTVPDKTNHMAGPLGTAVLTGKPDIARDILADPAFTAWRDDAVRKGYASSIALPLQDEERVFGTLNIYSPEPDAFDQKEVDLLTDLAKNLSYGIMSLREKDKLKQLERQLLQAQKMEAVGQLAGGVAHDFNNILSAIISYSFLLRNRLKEEDASKDTIDKILFLADRASRITKGLLDFGRKQNFEFLPVKLNDIIRNLEKLLVRFAGEDVEFRTGLSDRDPGIIADTTRIEQVIINLVTNARDSMPDGGILTVETDIAEIDDNFRKSRGFGEAGIYAMLSVRDTGAGMDEETRRRIFDPFFTTKGPDKGTGLGLSVTYSIVKQHNGYITVDSEPGKGATFRIYFPAIRMSSSMGKSSNIPDIMGKSETILLAEDEKDVRNSMKRILEEFGYKVIEAEDGKDAIEKFFVSKDEVRLLVIDAVMPGKKGREVFEEVKKMKPGIRAIITSGYSEEFLQRKNILDGPVTFLSKPILPHNFLAKIRAELEK
ncbi:MAG: response regulator [Nitrospiraceae bacterium]|nr:MAG: response regulator [Nitrospiraceae bacterium]